MILCRLLEVNIDKHICKAKRVNTGEWVYGYYVCVPHKYGHEMAHLIIEEDCEYDGSGEFWWMDVHEVDSDTVCQCTEVPDKNGKMLFEHDIVKMRSYNGGYHETEVYFKNGKFAVDGSHYGFKNICSNSVEFIRNKFDNTELME